MSSKRPRELGERTSVYQGNPEGSPRAHGVGPRSGRAPCVREDCRLRGSRHAAHWWRSREPMPPSWFAGCSQAFGVRKGWMPLVRARSDASVEMAIKKAFYCPEIAIEFSTLLNIYFSFPSHLTIVWFGMLAAGHFPCQSTAQRKRRTINLLGWAPGLLPTQAELPRQRPFFSPVRTVSGSGD